MLERETVVGRFCEERGVCFVIPDNKRINQDIIVPSDGRGEHRAGQIVIAELIEQPGSKNRPLGRIKEVLGEHYGARDGSPHRHRQSQGFRWTGRRR